MSDQNQRPGFFEPQNDFERSLLYRGDYETYWRIKGTAVWCVIIILAIIIPFSLIFRPLG